jgi:hypothetical protein
MKFYFKTNQGEIHFQFENNILSILAPTGVEIVTNNGIYISNGSLYKPSVF